MSMHNNFFKDIIDFNFKIKEMNLLIIVIIQSTLCNFIGLLLCR